MAVVNAFALLTALAFAFAAAGWAGVLKDRSLGRVGRAAVPTVAAFALGAVTLLLAAL